MIQPGGGGVRSLDPTYIAYNELRKRGVAAILEFMEPGTTGYGGGAMIGAPLSRIRDLRESGAG